jgi:hypothetical protein
MSLLSYSRKQLAKNPLTPHRPLLSGGLYEKADMIFFLFISVNVPPARPKQPAAAP